MGVNNNPTLRTFWCVVFLLGASCLVGAVGVFTTTKISPKPLWNTTIVDKLRKDLLYNYDKFSRPSQPFNKTTVQFQFYLKHVDLNEMKSTMTVLCNVRLEWKDEKMQWNSTNYDGIEVIHLAEHEIWQPDISLYNSAAGVSINSYGTTHLLAYDDGTILWIPPTQFSVLCDLDFTYWPFDEQKCYMKFGSWTQHGDQIDLLEKDKPEMSDLLVNNTEWLITEVNQTRRVDFYSCCAEPYPSINIVLSLKRISPSYKSIIVTPAFVIIVLTLLSFWLPPQAGEKVILNVCTAMIISLFMLYFTQKLPAMGSHTPLIGWVSGKNHKRHFQIHAVLHGCNPGYSVRSPDGIPEAPFAIFDTAQVSYILQQVLFYSSCLYLVSFSMIGSIIVISLSRTRHSTCLPWVIKRPLTGKVGYYLGLSCYINQSSLTASHHVTAEEMRDHQVTYFDEISQGDDNQMVRSASISSKPSIQQDWVLLAAAIDRILFLMYFFLFSILAIVYAL